MRKQAQRGELSKPGVWEMDLIWTNELGNYQHLSMCGIIMGPEGIMLGILVERREEDKERSLRTRKYLEIKKTITIK